METTLQIRSFSRKRPTVHGRAPVRILKRRELLVDDVLVGPHLSVAYQRTQRLNDDTQRLKRRGVRYVIRRADLFVAHITEYQRRVRRKRNGSGMQTVARVRVRLSSITDTLKHKSYFSSRCPLSKVLHHSKVLADDTAGSVGHCKHPGDPEWGTVHHHNFPWIKARLRVR